MSYLTPAGLEKTKKELEERKTVIRQEIADRIEEAKAMGDLSENAEYSSAKETQAFNEGRILELEEIVKNAVLIEAGKKTGPAAHRKAEVGSEIEAEMVGAAKKGERIKLTIVGVEEANPLAGRISNESPLGKAFLGRGAGEVVEAATPKGKTKYRIISIK